MRRVANQRDTPRYKALYRIAIREGPFPPLGCSAQQIPRGFVPARKTRFEKFCLAGARPELLTIGAEILVHDRDDIDECAAAQRIMNKMRLAPEPKICFLTGHRGRDAIGLYGRAPGGPPR